MAGNKRRARKRAQKKMKRVKQIFSAAVAEQAIEEEQAEESPEETEPFSWNRQEIDDEGVATVSGEIEMTLAKYNPTKPWHKHFHMYRKEVVVQMIRDSLEAITGIEVQHFMDCDSQDEYLNKLENFSDYLREHPRHADGTRIWKSSEAGNPFYDFLSPESYYRNYTNAATGAAADNGTEAENTTTNQETANEDEIDMDAVTTSSQRQKAANKDDEQPSTSQSHANNKKENQPSTSGARAATVVKITTAKRTKEKLNNKNDIDMQEVVKNFRLLHTSPFIKLDEESEHDYSDSDDEDDANGQTASSSSMGLFQTYQRAAGRSAPRDEPLELPPKRSQVKKSNSASRAATREVFVVEPIPVTTRQPWHREVKEKHRKEILFMLMNCDAVKIHDCKIVPFIRMESEVYKTSPTKDYYLDILAEKLYFNLELSTLDRRRKSGEPAREAGDDIFAGFDISEDGNLRRKYYRLVYPLVSEEAKKPSTWQRRRDDVVHRKVNIAGLLAVISPTHDLRPSHYGFQVLIKALQTVELRAFERTLSYEGYRQEICEFAHYQIKDKPLDMKSKPITIIYDKLPEDRPDLAGILHKFRDRKTGSRRIPGSSLARINRISGPGRKCVYHMETSFSAK